MGFDSDSDMKDAQNKERANTGATPNAGVAGMTTDAGIANGADAGRLGGRGATRRDFMKGAAVAAAGLALGRGSAASAASNGAAVTLGFDNFAVRDWKMNARQLIDYAAGLKIDFLFMSDLFVFENFEPPYLQELREKAAAAGLALYAGTGSVCPTSGTFNTKFGTAEEHLNLLIDTAHAIGSPVARCYLGNMGDRAGDGGIERHQEALIKVLKGARSRAVDKGVKIAVENHAGDQQAWELARLIEAAGKDFVGATMDAGNAAWTLENPLASLEILGPYAAITSMRDSAVWRDADGSLEVQWTSMGEGSVDWPKYVERYRALCPATPFALETINGGPRKFEILKDEFWAVYPKARAADLAAFLRLAQNGKPPAAAPPAEGADQAERNRNQQKSDLERSLIYCREKLGLGAGA